MMYWLQELQKKRRIYSRRRTKVMKASQGQGQTATVAVTSAGDSQVPQWCNTLYCSQEWLSSGTVEETGKIPSFFQLLLGKGGRNYPTKIANLGTKLFRLHFVLV